jgi:hypothetical protein
MFWYMFCVPSPTQLQLLIWKDKVLLAYSIQICTYKTSWNYFCFKTGLGKNGDGLSVVEAVPVYGLTDPTLQY